MTAPMTEEERSHMTERILNLTLEIIYLLTGESFPCLKSGDHVTITVPPCDSLKSKRPNMEKILEVTKKMMALLTGEVPIRCQDVTVEEGVGGLKHLYKDVMMEDQPPLTSPDGSRKRNPPHPRPLESTQEGRTTSHHDQGGSLGDFNIIVKEEYKDDDEAFGVMKELSDGHTNVMEPPNIRRRPKRCPRPLLSTQEGHHDQGEDLMTRIVEGDVHDESYAEEAGMMTIIEEDGMMRTFVEEDGIMKIFVEDAPTQISAGHAMGKPSKGRLALPKKRRTGRVGAGVPEEKTFSCPDCPKCFTSKLSLSVHRRSHIVVKLYKCSECGKCFSDKASLSAHQKSHVNKPYFCPACGKGFSDRSVFAKHQKSHTGEKSYSCPVCGKCFQLKSKLNIHQKSHTAKRPYSCLECGKNFTWNADLVVHRRYHTGEKPYSCNVCGKSFSQMGHLSTHRRIHTGERPYSCPECGKGFSQPAHLCSHLRIHTGEKPFSCPECGKCFSEKSNLSRHRRTHKTRKV